MAVRQYIGARYVPRFLGTYDATTIYEALDVVDNGAGTSYIARKTVPAGTSLTDTDYWFVYGASSGAILTLQNRMDTAENNISDLQAVTAGLTRRFIFISDSYGTISDNWIDDVISRLDLTLNDNAFKVAAASTGFIGDTSLQGDYTWLTLLTNAAGSITDHDTITDIIVCGGANDALSFTTSAALTTAIASFCTYCRSTYPNATISIGMIGNSMNLTRLNNLRAVTHCYKEVQKKAVYINNSEYLWRFSGFYTDDTHPSAVSSASIAGGIADYILTGTCQGSNSNGVQAVAFTPSGILAGGTSLGSQLTTGYDNGIATGSFEFVYSVSGNTFTCSDAWQELGSFTDTYIYGGDHLYIPGVFMFYDATVNQFMTLPAIYRIRNKMIYVKCPYKGSSGVADKVYSNVTQFKVIRHGYTCPTLGN